jgi:hypothetical protein
MTKEYLQFGIMEYSKSGKTKVYLVLNKSNGDEIGLIKWYRAWRQYCFFPYINTVFHDGCLEEIRNFLSELKNMSV